MKKEIPIRLYKSMFLASMLLFFYPIFTIAQQTEPVRSHALTERTHLKANAPDSLTIIAVRVQFQPDENRLTTGNGTFTPGNLSYLESPDITIDPLPHDQTYFENHLEFSKNYFETVSGQQMYVQYRVLDKIYELPNKMEDYSPTGETFTNEKVAHLVQDTWQAVDQEGSFSTDGLNPENTAFVIFHAGVGRDIELIGTNLNKTPQDIPSLYFDKNALADLLNIPSFDGFSVDESSFRITNSMVLPRSLSRPGEDVTGQAFVLQLSLNGLLTASIGSYLGLPDLFNTKTGNSGIGRFGLMDGESFFSYQGLFPPEPSAWEKIFLGWQTPFTITQNTSGQITLPASSLHQNNSISKYNLSTDEYFLIENRHRDPDEGGVELTITRPDGATEILSFDNLDETFVNQSSGFTELLTPGVVTDVSNYDWSLPGGLDYGPDETQGTEDDQLLNGGILIWHIDEAVIQQSLESQGVNADPQRRGVDLEEADGAQDIGRAANQDFSSQARGTAFDFWWKGNNASVVTLSGDTLSFYENRFGPDTRPSNESNSGAASYFELYNFSDNQPTASFQIRPRTGKNIQSVSLPQDTLSDKTTHTTQGNPYLNSYPLQLSIYRAAADSFLIIPSQKSTYALHLNDNADPIYDFQAGQSQQPYLGNSLILGEVPETESISLTSWQWDGMSWNSNWQTQAQANSAFISSTDDQTLLLDFTDQRINIADGTFRSSLAEAEQRSANINGNYASLDENNLRIEPGDNSYALSTGSSRWYTGVLKLSAEKSGFYLLSDRQLLMFDPQDITRPKAIVRDTPLGWPAIADINDDGILDFIYVNKSTNNLEARNINGAMLSFFPINPPKGSSYVGTPLIANVEDSDTPHIYATVQDSLGINIQAYNGRGESVDGFPLFVGSLSNPTNQPIHPLLVGNTLYTASHHGELKAWELDSVTDVLWGGRYGNQSNNKVSGMISSETSPDPVNETSILIAEETYNWPNPAEDYTNIRYQTNGSGHVDIKIITAGGTIVYDERFQSSGGAPEEHEIATQNWSSGLYLAMVTATVDGQQARKMVKMVVVH